MSDRFIIALLLSFSVLGGLVSSSPLKEGFSNDNTDLSLSISDKEITYTARYPKAKAAKVHAYVRESLHLTDLPDLKSLEIRDYHSPDGFISMYIKSRNGYLKVKMNRQKNSPEAFEQVRLTAEGVKKVLGEN